MEAPTPLRDLHWTPLVGPGRKDSGSRLPWSVSPEVATPERPRLAEFETIGRVGLGSEHFGDPPKKKKHVVFRLPVQ